LGGVSAGVELRRVKEKRRFEDIKMKISTFNPPLAPTPRLPLPSSPTQGTVESFTRSKGLKRSTYAGVGALTGGLVARGLTASAGPTLSKLAGISGGALAGALVGGTLGGFIGSRLVGSGDGFGEIVGGQMGAIVGAVVGGVAGGVGGAHLPAGQAVGLAVGSAALAGAAGGFLVAL
jgi:hypothetical protein